MIDLKNRSRETRTYQFSRDVSAGPVRPRVLDVARGKHNAKTGEVVIAPAQITVGGVLTLPPRATVRGLPESLLSHPSLKRDIDAREVVVVKHTKSEKPAVVAVPVSTPEPTQPAKSTARRRKE